MTTQELDLLFPDRRARCEELGLNPDEIRIPRRMGDRWTPEQCRAVFPHFAEVWRDAMHQPESAAS